MIPIRGHWFSCPAALEVRPKMKLDFWVSTLGLSARLIQRVKRGADHLGFINTQVTKGLVVPFWRPSPVTNGANDTL